MEQDKSQLIIYQVEDAASDAEKLDALLELEAFNYLIPPNKQLELGKYILTHTRQRTAEGVVVAVGALVAAVAMRLGC